MPNPKVLIREITKLVPDLDQPTQSFAVYLADRVLEPTTAQQFVDVVYALRTEFQAKLYKDTYLVDLPAGDFEIMALRAFGWTKLVFDKAFYDQVREIVGTVIDP